VQELVSLTHRAFYLADKYRNPVKILGDGMLGQMMEPVTWEGIELPPLPPKNWTIQGKGDRERRIILCMELDPRELENFNRKLEKKYQQMAEEDTDWEIFGEKDNPDLLLVGFGTVARILKSVVREGKKKGWRLSLIRPITLFPFPYKPVQEMAEKAGRVLVVEMSLGQMVEDVRLGVEGRVPVHFYGRVGGMIPTVDEVLQKIADILRGEGRK
jgi:2-oxoglutarate ferredoxin oxidoreductase subunit alpha